MIGQKSRNIVPSSKAKLEGEHITRLYIYNNIPEEIA